MTEHEDFLHIFYEIKNSLTFIGSSFQLLEKQHPEILTYPYYDDAMDEFKSLKNMISELSERSTTERLNIHALDLHSIFHTIHNTVRSMEETRNFFVHMTIEEELPCVLADEGRLKSTLLNLIKNSYEAMHETGTVHLNAFLKDNQIFIELQDFGGGIPESNQSRIFEAFFTDKKGGTGLGLSIAKEFMSQMHGQIHCISRPGDGCTFTLQLPMSKNKTDRPISAES